MALLSGAPAGAVVCARRGRRGFGYAGLAFGAAALLAAAAPPLAAPAAPSAESFVWRLVFLAAGAAAGVPAALSLDRRSWSAGDDAPLTPCLSAETALGLGLGVALAAVFAGAAFATGAAFDDAAAGATDLLSGAPAGAGGAVLFSSGAPLGSAAFLGLGVGATAAATPPG